MSTSEWMGIYERACEPSTGQYNRMKTTLMDATHQHIGLLHCQLHIKRNGAELLLVRSIAQIDCSRSNARILSIPIYLIAAAISSRAIPIVLFPRLTVATNCVELGKTRRDSYIAGPNVVRYIPPD